MWLKKRDAKTAYSKLKSEEARHLFVNAGIKLAHGGITAGAALLILFLESAVTKVVGDTPTLSEVQALLFMVGGGGLFLSGIYLRQGLMEKFDAEKKRRKKMARIRGPRRCRN